MTPVEATEALHWSDWLDDCYAEAGDMPRDDDSPVAMGWIDSKGQA